MDDATSTTIILAEMSDRLISGILVYRGGSLWIGKIAA
jgi:hypothetical protein